MARASLRRSSLRRHSRRLSATTHQSRGFRNSLKDGLRVAHDMNESIWRRIHYFIRRDGAGQYIALRKAALFFTMSFWTYFGVISLLCHMADTCGPLEKTIKTIENLNGFLYWLLFASLVFGTVVFSLSTIDMMIRSALQSLDSASQMGLGRKSLRAHGGGDPEFMSSTMMRPRLRKSAILLPPSGPLPPPASPIARNRSLRQSSRVTTSEKTPYRRPSRTRGGSKRRSSTRTRRSTTPAPIRGRSASIRRPSVTGRPSASLGRASRTRDSAGATYRLRTRSRSMSRRLPRGAPIVRRSLSVTVPNRVSLSRPVVAKVHSTEARRYYSLPGTLRQQRRSVDQTYTFRAPSLNINPAGITYRPPTMAVQTRKRTYRRRY